MIYEVKLHPKVDKFLNKLEKDVSERIKQRLKMLKKDPFLYLEHYKGACLSIMLSNIRFNKVKFYPICIVNKY